jgi:hypothetical protein
LTIREASGFRSPAIRQSKSAAASSVDGCVTDKENRRFSAAVAPAPRWQQRCTATDIASRRGTRNQLEANMLGIGGKGFATGTMVLTCAFALGCSGGMAPGSVQLGLVRSTESTAMTVQTASTSSHKLVDAVVTINEIDAHVVGSGWQPVMTQPISVDLLHLDGQQMTALGLGQLPTGHINRLRLVLDTTNAFVTDAGGHSSALELPNNGVIKVVGDLDLDNCAAGTVILDFDPKIRNDSDDECGNSGCNHHKQASGESFRLRSKATIRTEEVQGMCGGGGTGGSGGGNGGQCGNGNTVCTPDQICRNGDCVDPCLGVTCGNGSTCIKGQCVSNDPCQDPDHDNDND